MTSSPDGSGFEKLPEEIMFSITRASNGQSAARLGMLKIVERKTIETPHYIGITSRGVVAHLSQDNFAKLTDIRGVYMALEDCTFVLHMKRHEQLHAADTPAHMTNQKS